MPTRRLSPRVGWVGTGVMGRWMAQHLLARGFPLTVTNRTREKAQPLLDLDAAFAATPLEVARNSDVVFTMVGYPRDVEEVVLGPDGVLAGLAPGSMLVDMTTSTPALAVRIAEAAAAKDIQALDAPVTGGDVGAKNATLSIMVGGAEASLTTVRPLLEFLGKTIVHHGGPGAGQTAKLVNQILIASTMVAVCEGLLFGARAGLDLDKVIQSVGVGAAGSKALEVLGPRMLQGDMAPGFYIEHFVKDLGIALDEARRLNLTLPGLELAKTLYERTAAAGHARAGTQALWLTLRAMNGE